MFILPVGHERDELRRWPWVSITLAAVCVAVFLWLLAVEKRAERAAMDAAREVFAYAADKPYLVIDEDLLFGETASLAGESWSYPGWEIRGDEPAAREIRQQQAELDRLTSEWRRVRAAVPIRALGLVPADFEPHRLVTHVFVHAGLLHLVGNLFFFWLLAPPLEDVWGRPLFAAFFLAAGMVAGLLWVARYPNSHEVVVGASGAVAGLMGAFMVRFWRTRIRFVGFLWVTLKIYAGSFKAPAWLMLGLWFVRELAFSSLLEPHALPGGGVATWAHLFGFGFGALAALAIRGLKIEQRWIRPGIVEATGELRNPVLERAIELERKGRPEEAWRLLAEAGPGNPDAALYFWDLARKSGREREASGQLLAVIRVELRSGQNELAWQHWQELEQALPDLEIPAELKVRLAESLLGEPETEHLVGELLASARAQLGTSPPPGLMVRLARTGARAGLPGAGTLCLRIAADPDLPDTVRRELRELAARSAPAGPSAGPNNPREENS